VISQARVDQYPYINAARYNQAPAGKKRGLCATMQVQAGNSCFDEFDARNFISAEPGQTDVVELAVGRLDTPSPGHRARSRTKAVLVDILLEQVERAPQPQRARDGNSHQNHGGHAAGNVIAMDLWVTGEKDKHPVAGNRSGQK
jgi:hypothetical protein